MGDNLSITCPKCHYQRQSTDSRTHEGICPRCGIAYAKFRARASIPTDTSGPLQNTETDFQVPSEAYDHEIVPTLGQRIISTITAVPERVDSITFWGRMGLFALFQLWGASFIVGGVNWESIGGSFMHSINLPFHEFGHVLFGFFGRFMGILGGSLFQVIFPLVFVCAFSIQRRDNFAASICLWWCGQNFIDVSPYIADAKYRAIPLIGGLGEEYHDWGNLLTMTDAIDSAGFLANTSFALGCIILLLSFSWGGWQLLKQYEKRDQQL